MHIILLQSRLIGKIYIAYKTLDIIPRKLNTSKYLHMYSDLNGVQVLKRVNAGDVQQTDEAVKR